MTLIERVEAALKTAILNKDKFTVTKLKTLKGEIQRVQASPTDTPSNELVVKVIEKSINGLNTTIEALVSTGQHYTEQTREIKLLESFLPSKMSEDLIRATVNDIIDQLDNVNIGTVMKTLKEQYNGQYDGGVASKVVKVELAKRS